MQISQVTLRGTSYPLEKKGRGLPCLALGIGSPTLRTLSPTFFNHFEVYGSDLYFIEDYGLKDVSQVTLETLLEDIKAIEQQLGLHQYILFGHSAFGILALEFIKRYPEEVSALLMAGTPVNINAEVAARHNKIFEETADPLRKKIDAERRAQVAKENLENLTSSERFLREYIYRDAPRYWHNPEYDCRHVWKGLVLDPLVERLFTHIFPAIDVTKNLGTLTTPVFFAAGLSDYDCCPWLWEDVPTLPPNMVISLFEKSGHWPHFEEADLFDSRVLEWLKQQGVALGPKRL